MHGAQTDKDTQSRSAHEFPDALRGSAVVLPGRRVGRRQTGDPARVHPACLFLRPPVKVFLTISSKGICAASAHGDHWEEETSTASPRAFHLRTAAVALPIAPGAV